jgi:hypothetical protein
MLQHWLEGAANATARLLPQMCSLLPKLLLSRVLRLLVRRCSPDPDASFSASAAWRRRLLLRLTTKNAAAATSNAPTTTGTAMAAAKAEPQSPALASTGAAPPGQ